MLYVWEYICIRFGSYWRLILRWWCFHWCRLWVDLDWLYNVPAIPMFFWRWKFECATLHLRIEIEGYSFLEIPPFVCNCRCISYWKGWISFAMLVYWKVGAFRFETPSGRPQGSVWNLQMENPADQRNQRGQVGFEKNWEDSYGISMVKVV